MMWQTLVSLWLVVAPAAPFTVQTVDGESATGTLVRLDAAQLVLAGTNGEVSFPVASLAAVNRSVQAPAADAKATVTVELIDESRVYGVDFTAAANKVQLKLADGTTLRFVTSAIRWVRFGPVAQQDSKLTKQWSEIVESKADGDLLVIRKEGALDYLEGVVGDVSDEACTFEYDKEPIQVKRPKIEGLVYFQAKPSELPEAIGRLILADGSQWALRTASVADGKLQAGTVTGTQLELPLEAVARFDFSTGKVAYLSDLEPESAAYTPYIAFAEAGVSVADAFQYRRDVGFDQSPLQLDGKVYRKGLSLQSRTELSYKLPGKFRQFRAVVGIDDSTRDTGNVHLEIKGDGKTLWQGEVIGSQPAQPLELELTNVKRLEILADYGAGLDVGDRLNLCEARVSK